MVWFAISAERFRISKVPRNPRIAFSSAVLSGPNQVGGSDPVKGFNKLVGDINDGSHERYHSSISLIDNQAFGGD